MEVVPEGGPENPINVNSDWDISVNLGDVSLEVNHPSPPPELDSSMEYDNANNNNLGDDLMDQDNEP